MVFKNFNSPHVVRSYKRRSRASYCRTPIRTPTSTNKGKAANIKVCVRVRPPNPAEAIYGESRTVVRPLDDKVLVFDPRELQAQTFFKGRIIKDPTSKRNKDLKLAFDRVFDVDASNQDVFEDTTKDMLDHLLDGVNCSVFAYGATGAGKTFTMLGTSSAPGVIFRTMQHLYDRIDAAKEDVTCDVLVSYLEVYNETVRDLLNPESGLLAVREDGDQGISVVGLTMHQPSSADDLFKMLDFGNCNRTQHPTDANKESSRSHAVFQLYLKQSPKTVDISSDVLLSKMVLIDLAGSERATATTNSGERFREGANINKSLLSLGNCINALAEGKKGAHIPYRDSKLTRILKDSLGGTCHTVMIANVSPSSLSYEDTYNTLKYADRAKHIKADLKKNVIRVDQHIHQYKKIVQQLHAEIDEWKAKFREAQRNAEQLQQKLDRFALESVAKSCCCNCPPEKSFESPQCEKTFLVEATASSSIPLSSSPSFSLSYSNGVFSPLRDIGNQQNLNVAFSKCSPNPPRSKPKTTAFGNADFVKPNNTSVFANTDFVKSNAFSSGNFVKPNTPVFGNTDFVKPNGFSNGNFVKPYNTPVFGNTDFVKSNAFGNGNFLKPSAPTVFGNTDDDVFKKPAMPVPRKCPSISASQRKNMEDVKKYGLPSFTENYVLNKRPVASASSKASPLTKSPSFSNLRDNVGRSTHQLKKTFSSSNLRRS